MQFRDPRIPLAPGHRALDTAVNAAADLITTAVARHEQQIGQPGETGFWTMCGEIRALDLIDAAFARKRDQLEGVAMASIPEREYDVAIDRLRRNTEQAIRARVAVAEERGEDPREALSAVVELLRLQVAHLGRWISAEILPDAGV